MLEMMRKTIEALMRDMEKMKQGGGKSDEKVEEKEDKCGDGEVQVGRKCFGKMTNWIMLGSWRCWETEYVFAFNFRQCRSTVYVRTLS